VRLCPTSGKRQHTSYGDALAALDARVRVGALDPLRSSVYVCRGCGLYHVSSRRFTVVKGKGRGKTRPGVVF
jgi:hypothetical protein